MKNVTLQIENYDGAKTVTLEDETSFGRTDAARIVLGDSGLSRLNTSFFRDEEAVFVVDENSTNGTFVNGEKISGAPRQIFDGDQIKIGSETRIRVEIGRQSAVGSPKPEASVGNQPSEDRRPKAEDQKPPTENLKSKTQNPKTAASPLLIIASVGSTLLILFLGIAGFLIVSNYEGDAAKKKPNLKQKIVASAPIPIRVVDPLGGGVPDTLDDLVEAWEVQDAEFEAKDLVEIKTSTDAPQLTVSVANWEEARNLAMGRRNAPVGLVSGVQIPPELGGGIAKQLAIFEKMGITPEKLPKDYAALARMRNANQLVELPLATKYYYLDGIGTSADGSPFISFDGATRLKSPLLINSEDYAVIQALANNYNGQKYDLNDPASRLQMKRRLLRMFHPRAKAFLEELGKAYQEKFNRPLKVTSLTRSLEYQFDLAKDTRNAYRGRTPPHSTGATFDLAYMHMTAEEQTFLMSKLAEYERAGRIDALREVAQTPCIHMFVFP
ncbi:MAG: DUF5715 family protein [Pyrinomonadaceae bacterium]|nr:DUF5715 family protein [Pyrinomonadaceae bacterium]